MDDGQDSGLYAWMNRKRAMNILRKELERNTSLGKRSNPTVKELKFIVLKRISMPNSTTIEHSCTCISVSKQSEREKQI